MAWMPSWIKEFEKLTKNLNVFNNVSIGHNPSIICKSHHINEICMCSDHISTIFEDESSPKKFGGKLFEKETDDQKDILFYSSPRPSTTYLQAPKSTPDYFQAERSFSGNRQVILKTEYIFSFIGIRFYVLSFTVTLFLMKAFTYLVWRIKQIGLLILNLHCFWGHWITTWTRWGEKVKIYLFFSTLRV